MTSPTMMNSSPNNNKYTDGPRPVTPNTLLAMTSNRRLNSGRRQHHSLSPNTVRKQPLSASIPLPKSHIHRTPSELQLADDMRRAEYEDVRMYSRLVVGMQSQCQVSGYVHPLTRKSLQDILRTKQANDEELERTSALHHHEEEEGDWEISYHGADERDETSVDTPLPCHPMGTSKRAPTVVKTPSDRSIMSNLSTSPPPESQEEAADPEDDFVFSLEL